MIDSHCHLLPCLDDGPETLGDAIALAVDMRDQGIRHAICTPHFSRLYPTDHTAAQEALEMLEEELAARGIALELTLAAEVSELNAVELGRAALQERAIGGRFLVVELGQRSTAKTAEATIGRLRDAGFVPIVAHPERLPLFQTNPATARALRDRGALLQVVAPSITGRWGVPAERTAWSMLADRVVDLVGSDCHGALRRRCWMAEAAARVRRQLGDHAWRAVAVEGPAQLVGES
jgi:protein-tyrosine phosphatase